MSKLNTSTWVCLLALCGATTMGLTRLAYDVPAPSVIPATSQEIRTAWVDACIRMGKMDNARVVVCADSGLKLFPLKGDLVPFGWDVPKDFH